jgi:uncharacterized protein (TIGR00255 family)
MIKSMTGFGQSAGNRSDYNITVEIKSLNSKFLDLSLRLPRLLNEKELEIRNLIADKLERGKINLNIELTVVGRQEMKVKYNETCSLRTMPS